MFVEDAYSGLILKALGHRIRELRTERGYSQEAFADKCGVHRTFMGTVERGESNLSFQNIAKVAMMLDVTLSTLFQDLESRATLVAAKRHVRAKTHDSKRMASPPKTQ